MVESVGVWMIGALGGVGTTVVVGARAAARGLVPPAGLLTERPELAPLGLVGLGDLVFGGHEVRLSNFHESAREIARTGRSIDSDLVETLKHDLLDISEALKPGTSVNSGDAIAAIVENPVVRLDDGLRAIVQRIQSDLRAFRARESVDRVIVVNLASTEPDLPEELLPATPEEFERLLDSGDTARVRPSMLYAYAAFQEGCAYVNFTPSSAPLAPALQALATRAGLPFIGSDGKTGETLVKSALAPMFRARDLRVLSWMGYNMLGDRDGRVLSNSENLASKIRTKDSVLSAILGYPVQTRVGIDFVESLGDMKTAWDFIHFEGFLGHRMSLQFTWAGCDSILAAPLVLDLVRLTELALRKGESGPMSWLAPYFKAPLGATSHDLHEQYRALHAKLESWSPPGA